MPQAPASWARGGTAMIRNGRPYLQRRSRLAWPVARERHDKRPTIKNIIGDGAPLSGPPDSGIGVEFRSRLFLRRLIHGTAFAK